MGAIVSFNDHSFLLTGADEYVYQYMEDVNEREKVRLCPIGFSFIRVLGFFVTS